MTQKGISGGEKKRTSIAYEIISNPPVVIIDEPTTGMDSFTSVLILKYLKQMANTGKTISKLNYLSTSKYSLYNSSAKF